MKSERSTHAAVVRWCEFCLHNVPKLSSIGVRWRSFQNVLLYVNYFLAYVASGRTRFVNPC